MLRYDKAEVLQDLSPEAITSEVERILASEKFARSKRLRKASVSLRYPGLYYRRSEAFP